jgi:hypothetical protein
VGDTVHLAVINGDPVAHDLTIDEFKVYTGELVMDEQTVTLEFTVTQLGEFKDYCSVPGHLLHVEGPDDTAIFHSDSLIDSAGHQDLR